MYSFVRGPAALGACLLLVGAALVAAALEPAHAVEPKTPYSTSDAIRVEMPAISSLGQSAFDGTQGTARSGSRGGTDSADFSDPDGVQRYLTAVVKQSVTLSHPAPPSADATTDLNTVVFRLNDRASRPLFTLATLHNYARCAPPAAAQTGTSLVAPAVLGKPVSTGTNSVSGTGAELGFPSVDRADLTVRITEEKEVDGVRAARSRVVVTFDAVLSNADGSVAYDGRLARLVLGDERAVCQPCPTPPPSPTPTPGPQTPTMSPTPPPPSPSPSPEPTTPAPQPTDPPGPTDSPTQPSDDHDESGLPPALGCPDVATPVAELPRTGVQPGLAFGGVGLLTVGAALLLVRRKRLSC